MVTELSSGPFLAIEIGCANPNQSPYCCFRQLCGPFDPVTNFHLSKFEDEIKCLYFVILSGDCPRDSSKNDTGPFWCGYSEKCRPLY